MTKSVLPSFLFVLICLLPWLAAAQPKARTLTPGNKQFTYRNYQLPGPRIELGLMGGAVYPFTDVAPGEPDTQPAITDFRFKSVDLNTGLFFRYRFNDLYAVKGTASYHKLKGDDFWAETDTVRDRGRSFTNELYELAAIGEFYIPKRKGNEVKNSWFDVILFAGVAGIYHDPQVYGPIIDPYDLEQQNDPRAYKNFAVAFPTGIILQYNYLNKWTVGLDMNWRWTFTDFLDGFDRPTNQRPDYYFTTNLTFSYVLTYSPRKSNTTLARKVFKPKRSNAGNQGFL